MTDYGITKTERACPDFFACSVIHSCRNTRPGPPRKQEHRHILLLRVQLCKQLKQGFMAQKDADTATHTDRFHPPQPARMHSGTRLTWRHRRTWQLEIRQGKLPLDIGEARCGKQPLNGEKIQNGERHRYTHASAQARRRARLKRTPQETATIERDRFFSRYGRRIPGRHTPGRPSDHREHAVCATPLP